MSKTTKTESKVDEVKDKLEEEWRDLILTHEDHFLADLETQKENGDNIPTLELDIKELEEKNKDNIIDNIVKKPLHSLEVLKKIVKTDLSFDDVFLVLRNPSIDVENEMKGIREFRSRDIGKLVVFKGLVRNSTGVVPKLKSVAFFCDKCGSYTYCDQDGDEPNLDKVRAKCCKAGKEDLEIHENENVFINYMKCEVEEDPEGLKGRQPERVSCEISGALTDEANRIGVGDRVTILGVYKARKKNKTSLTYDGYVQVLGIIKRGKNFEGFKISKEEEAKFKLMSQDKDLLVKMSKTIAPNISGHDVEKSAIVLQLLGGNLHSKERRGDIHILLIGDPGVGKSRLVRYITEIAPHVVKASGAPTTTVGLTACVRKDEESSGGFILEAGAAVLADGGLLIVDEFDKMDKDVRGALHEIMEDQVCTVAKANINTTLRTRCSVLAIMNPKRNRFEKGGVVSEQIDLPASLLSRFDLIFALRDVVDEEKDRKICAAILRSRQGNEVATEYTKEEMTKYIIYAKSTVGDITYSEQAVKMLTDKFVEIRSSNKDETIPITNRQMEGLSRIAEAAAKLRLSNVVEEEDAKMAIGILNYYLNTMCLDPTTGKPNYAMVGGDENAGQHKTRVGLESFIKENYASLTDNVKKLIDAEKLEREFMSKTGATEKEFGKAMMELVERDHKLLKREGGRYFVLADKHIEKAVLKDEY